MMEYIGIFLFGLTVGIIFTGFLLWNVHLNNEIEKLKNSSFLLINRRGGKKKRFLMEKRKFPQK
jgi:hypothetical protein|tara:strand:+ start:14562 stop:14753 length:192 start_codon:yes stop_codon:yes gene_type:complete